MKQLLVVAVLFANLSHAQQPLADSLFHQNSLRETLFVLSSDSLNGRLTGSRGADSAATFIASKFRAAGLKSFTGLHNYVDSFTAIFEGKKIPAKNIVGVLPGKPGIDSMVIFSAHYDHIGRADDMPYNKDYTHNDDIFNGANDNATGVAALLELVKYYTLQNANRSTILFVAFSGEEMGMLGSEHFIQEINPARVKAVINIEMLGRPINDDCYIVSFRNTPIRNMLNKYLKRYQPTGTKRFFEDDPYPDEELSSRSDHYPFSKKIKISFTIMGSSPADTYYHSVDDEYETIDFGFLLKATKNIALACEQFVF